MINGRHWRQFSPPIQKSSLPSSIIFAKAFLSSFVNALMVAKAFFTSLSGVLLSSSPFCLLLLGNRLPCALSFCIWSIFLASSASVSLQMSTHLHPWHWGLSSLLVCTSFCSSSCHYFSYSGQRWLLLLASLYQTGSPSRTNLQLFMESPYQTWSCGQGSSSGLFWIAQSGVCCQTST